MNDQHVNSVALIEKNNFSEPWSMEAFRNTIDNKDYIYIVALHEEKVVGYAGCMVAVDEGDITNIAVTKDYRNAGIGAQLLLQLELQAEKRSVQRMFLEVRKSNESAIGLYRKSGYETVGIRKNFYRKPDEDAYVMCKKIETSGS